MGACRCQEIADLTLDRVEDLGGTYLIKIPEENKTNVYRSFTVSNLYYDMFKSYLQLRPEKAVTNRVFYRYEKGRCFNQVIGKNTISEMPKIIATYLNLPDVEDYTGHSFRRTSATFLCDGGADLLAIKRQGGWKSLASCERYLEESIMLKKRNEGMISNVIGVGGSGSTERIYKDGSEMNGCEKQVMCSSLEEKKRKVVSSSITTNFLSREKKRPIMGNVVNGSCNKNVWNIRNELGGNGGNCLVRYENERNSSFLGRDNQKCAEESNNVMGGKRGLEKILPGKNGCELNKKKKKFVPDFDLGIEKFMEDVLVGEENMPNGFVGEKDVQEDCVEEEFDGNLNFSVDENNKRLEGEFGSDDVDKEEVVFGIDKNEGGNAGNLSQLVRMYEDEIEEEDWWVTQVVNEVVSMEKAVEEGQRREKIEREDKENIGVSVKGNMKKKVLNDYGERSNGVFGKKKESDEGNRVFLFKNCNNVTINFGK